MYRLIFLYNLYILFGILHGCLTNTVSALDPNNSFIKQLWCIRLGKISFFTIRSSK